MYMRPIIRSNVMPAFHTRRPWIARRVCFVLASTPPRWFHNRRPWIARRVCFVLASKPPRWFHTRRPWIARRVCFVLASTPPRWWHAPSKLMSMATNQISQFLIRAIASTKIIHIHFAGPVFPNMMNLSDTRERTCIYICHEECVRLERITYEPCIPCWTSYVENEDNCVGRRYLRCHSRWTTSLPCGSFPPTVETRETVQRWTAATEWRWWRLRDDAATCLLCTETWSMLGGSRTYLNDYRLTKTIGYTVAPRYTRGL